MVIRDLNVVGISFVPPEADSPLFVDAYAMITGTIAIESLKPVPWRNTEIIKFFRGVEDHKFLPGDSMQVRGDAPRKTTLKDLLGFFVAERSYHYGQIIA